MVNALPFSFVTSRAVAVWRFGPQVVLFALASSVAGGCADYSEAAQSPSDQAAQVVRTRCAADASEAELAPVLDGTAIESVVPLYNAGMGGSRVGNYSQLIGSAITIRPLPGMSAEWLTHALECHSARRVAGNIPASVAPNDPFWLPGRTLEIDAQSIHGAFRIEVRAAGPADGRQVLDRARAFTRTASPTATL